MTKVKFLTFLVFSLWLSWAGAVSPLCKESFELANPCAIQSRQSPTGNLSALEQKLWVASTAESLQDIYKFKKDQFANMFRLIENGKLDDKKLEPAIKKEIDATMVDAESLFVLTQTINAVKARLQICYTRALCSAGGRSDLEHQLLQLQITKSSLLVKRPLFTHPLFEEQLQKTTEDNPIKPDDLKKIISQASRETAATLLDRVDAYSRFLDSEMKELPPMIADDFVNRFEMEGAPAGQEKWLCSLASTREKTREREAFTKKGIEVSLLVLPLALGPWGRFGLLGAETLLGAKLLRFGMTAKEIDGAAWLARAGAGVVTSSHYSMEARKTESACKKTEQDFFIKPTTATFEKFNTCKAEVDDARFIETLSWISAIGTELPGPAFKFYKAKFTPQLAHTKEGVQHIGEHLQKNPLGKNQWAKEFETKDQGRFTYMDLSKLERVSDHRMRQVPDDYWKFVGGIYSERLNLTPDEIKGFIKSSQDFAPRTKLIINSTESIKEAKTFNGGVGIVVSDRAQDLLPVEKAVSKNLTRKPGEKVAEIVRLTVSKDADAEKLSKSLINQAAGALLQDKEIKTVYIYTSKIHARLYKRIGVKAESITPEGDRDVIIALSRSDVENLLAKTR